MSRLPSTKANAAKGTAIRAAGFQTGIHANPQVKEFVDTKFKDGTRPTAIHREGVNQFGKKDFPSLPALKNYITKYLKKEVQTTATIDLPIYAPNYIEKIRDHDIYVKAIECHEMIMKLINAQMEREGKLAFISQTMMELFKEAREYKKVIWQMERDMQLRGDTPQAVGLHLHQHNTTINATTGTSAEEWEEDDLLSLDAFIKTRQQLEGDDSAPVEGEVIEPASNTQK